MPAQKHASLFVPNQYPILKYERNKCHIEITSKLWFVFSNSIITNANIKYKKH